MEAKFSSDILAVLFFILFLVQQGSADEVDSLFGGDTSDKDAVLYTGIIVGVVSAFAVIFVIVALCLTYRAAKIINRHRTSRDNDNEDHRDSYDERDAMMMREKRRTDESSEEERKPRKKKDDSDEEYDNRRRNTREQPKRKSLSDDERYEKPRESAKNRSDEAPKEDVDLVISSL